MRPYLAWIVPASEPTPCLYRSARHVLDIRHGPATLGTRGAAEDHFLGMRLRYALNTPVDNQAEHEDLLALLERYDEAIHDGPSKTGKGVAHFETRMNRTNGGTNIGFWVVRVDNSETDFSIIKAVAAKQAELEDKWAAAASAKGLKDPKAVLAEFRAEIKKIK